MTFNFTQGILLRLLLFFQIKEEAAKRKALRDAKLRMNEAIKNASKTKSPEEIAAEVMREAERRKEEELAALRQKEEDEKAARAGLKIAFMLA